MRICEILLQMVLGEFLAAEILKSRRDLGENLGEFLAGEISNLGHNFAGEGKQIKPVQYSSFFGYNIWKQLLKDYAS